jgi:hypothetical protein
MKAFCPCAVTLAALLLPCVARAENLLKNASFEAPSVEGRVGSRKGGDPSLAKTETSWAHFQTMDKEGKITVGMTTEVARTGKQAIYVQFDGATTGRGAFLMTDLIPIKAEEAYHMSLWGRLDRKKPLSLDQGRPYMQVVVDFLLPDQATNAGDTEFRTQMIPGSPKRLMFLSGKWTEYFADFKAPKGAAFMKLSFHWESPKGEHPASGTIYFDDAVLEGIAGTLVPLADPPGADDEEPAAPNTPPAGSAAAPPSPK